MTRKMKHIRKMFLVLLIVTQRKIKFHALFNFLFFIFSCQLVFNLFRFVSNIKLDL